MKLKELAGDSNDRWGDIPCGLSEAGLSLEDEGEAEVLFESIYSPEGYGSSNVELIFQRSDGTIVAVASSCDTTGWDCQAGGEHRIVASLEDGKKFIRGEHSMYGDESP